MNQDTTFRYEYSAKENREIEEIRKRYLPKGESKMDELVRLDALVQGAGVAEALAVGITGMLVFGLGMCLAMQVIGSGIIAIILGILIGIAGAAVMMAAYPVYRKVFGQTKEKYAERILDLAEELSCEK